MKKTRTRILSFLLTVCMLLTLLPTVAFAADTYTVSGTITDSATGLAITDAMVVLNKLEGSTTQGGEPNYVNGEGEYTITGVVAGTYRIVAMDASGKYQFNETGRFNVTDSDITGKDIALTKISFSISGTVTDTATGAGLSNAAVQLQKIENNSASNAGDPVYTDTDGKYTISDVAAGTYQISVTDQYNKYITISTKNFNVTDSDITGKDIALTKIILSVGGTITGSDTNAGLSGAIVQLKNGDANVYNPVTTNASGAYTIPGISVASTKTYTIEVSKEGYTTGTIPSFTLTNIDVADKDLTLTKITTGTNTYTVSGTISDADGALAGASVQLKNNSDTNVGNAATTDASGNYTINSVPAGTYTAEVSKDGYTTDTITSFTVTNANVSGKDITLTKAAAIFVGNLDLADGPIVISATGYKQGSSVTTETAETAYTGDYTITGSYTDAGLAYNSGAAAVVRIDGLAEGKKITLDGATITPSGASDHALNITSAEDIVITNSVTMGSIITTAPISMTGTGSLTLNDDITSNATNAIFSAVLSGNISWDTKGTNRAKINHLESTGGNVTVSNAKNLCFSGATGADLIIEAAGDVSITNTSSNHLVSTIYYATSLQLTAGGTLTLTNGGDGVPAVGCSGSLTAQKLVLSVAGVPITLDAGEGGTVVYPVEYNTPYGSFTTATYQWKSHTALTDTTGTAIEGATEAVYAPTASGWYSCTVTSGSSVSTAIMTVTKVAPTPISYGVYVGDTEITSANAADVLGNGTVSYDMQNKKLTLNGASISTVYSYAETSWYSYGINIYATNDLTIILKGSNSLSGGAMYGIKSDGALTIQNGDTGTAVGSLEMTAQNSVLCASGALEVKSGEITISQAGTQAGQIGLVQSSSSITLSGGKVIFKETNTCYGMNAGDSIVISGGEHTIIGDTRYALRAVNNVTITGATVNAKTLDTRAYYAAISANTVTVNGSSYSNAWQGVKITPTSCTEWIVPVTGITIKELTYVGGEKVYTPVTTLSLLPAAGAYLSAEIAPDDAIVKAVTWLSSDETIVEVSDRGDVSALRPGTATITATTTAVDANGKQLTASVVVTVGKVTDVSLPTDNMTLPAGIDTFYVPLNITTEEGYGTIGLSAVRVNVSAADEAIVSPEIVRTDDGTSLEMRITVADSVAAAKTVAIPIQVQDAEGNWVTKDTLKVTVEPVASDAKTQAIFLGEGQTDQSNGFLADASITDLYIVMLGDDNMGYFNRRVATDDTDFNVSVSGTGTMTITGGGTSASKLTVLGHASIYAVLPNCNYAFALFGDEVSGTTPDGEQYVDCTGKIYMFSDGTLRFSGKIKAVYNLFAVYGKNISDETVSLTQYLTITDSKTLTITKDKVTAGDLPTVSANDITVTYDGNPVSADKITGTASYNGLDVPGTWSWLAGQDITNVADSGSKRVQFTPNDSTTYATVTTNAILTITPATPAVTGVTVTAQASIYAGTDLSTIELAHTDGIAGKLAMTAGQTLTAGTNNYSWTFTPEDGNYGIATGAVSLTVIAGLPYDTTVYSQTDVECINAFLRNNVTVTGTAVKPAMNDPEAWGTKQGTYAFVTWTETAPKRVQAIMIVFAANADISGDLDFSPLTKLKYIQGVYYFQTGHYASNSIGVAGLNFSGLTNYIGDGGANTGYTNASYLPNLETLDVAGCTALKAQSNVDLSASQSITGFSGKTYSLSDTMQTQNAKLRLKDSIISLIPVIPEGKVVGSVTIGGKAYTAGEWNDLEANFSANAAITNVTFRDPDTTLASVTVDGVSAAVDNTAHTATVHIPYTAENATVAATPTLNTGTVSGAGSQTLATGENTVTLTVHDGASTQEYTLTVVMERGVTISDWAVGQAAATPVIYTVNDDFATRTAFQYKAANAADTAYQEYDPEVSGKYPTSIGDYILKATFTGGPDYFSFTTATTEFSVTKASITPAVTVAAGSIFNGSAQQPTVTVKVSAAGAELVATDYTLTWSGNINAGTNTASVTVKAAANGNYTFDDVTESFSIAKATAPTLTDQTMSIKYNATTENQLSMAGLMPNNAGAITYGKGSDSVITGVTSWSINAASGLVTFALTGSGTAGTTVTLPVSISSANYGDASVNVVVSLTEKDNQAALTITGGTTVTYGNTLTLTASGGNGTGEVSYAVTDGTGAAKVNGAVLTPTKAGTVMVTATRAGDNYYNPITSEAVTITISKATPTGTPTHSKITTTGKTLADANIDIGSIIPAGGSIAWDLATDTAVVANTAYAWTYTPLDINSYNNLTGSITLYTTGGAGTGGSSSGGGSAITTPSTSTSGDTTTTTTTVTPSTNGTASSVTVSTSTMSSAVNGAISGANSNNTTPAVEIKVNTPSRAESISVTLPRTAMSTLSKEDGATLTITSGVANITLDRDALAAIAEQVDSNVTIKVEPIAKTDLNARQQAIVGDNPVFDISITSGSVTIHDLGGGKVEVSVPYTLTNGQSATGLTVYYLDDNGNLTACKTSYANGVLTFVTTHLSKYVIMYAVHTNPQTGIDMDFTDVKDGDWFYEDVAYVFDKGLMRGTSATTFTPDASTTRGMIVAILYRLAGEPAVSSANPFDDVKFGSYYEDAITWAAANGIVGGYGNSKFGPDDAITREQMAAIMFRYASYKGYAVTGAADLSKFTDNGKISGYASTALSWANAEGLVTGKGNGILDPQGEATRAQVAAILTRFCENVVK